MKCRQIRTLLSTYRELGSRERTVVDAHLASCETCQASLQRYQAQNQSLANLPQIKPVTRPSALLDRAQARPVQRRWVYAVVLAGVLFMGGFGATAQVSADALPGEPLYPFKRAMESVRQAVTVREEPRAVFEQELAERRRAEARDLQELRRSAEISFEGRVEAAADGYWTVEGLRVAVAADVWQGGAPLGQWVRLRVRAADGQLTALAISLWPPAQGYPGRDYPGPATAPGQAYPSPGQTPAPAYPAPYPAPGVNAPGNAYPGPLAPGNVAPGTFSPDDDEDDDNEQPGNGSPAVAAPTPRAAQPPAVAPGNAAQPGQPASQSSDPAGPQSAESPGHDEDEGDDSPDDDTPGNDSPGPGQPPSDDSPGTGEDNAPRH